MKIIYTENPLASRVELDESDLALIRVKLILEGTYDAIFDAYYDQTERVKIQESLETIINSQGYKESDIEKEADRVMPYYVAALQNETHCGDCTKVACSCTKCHAEDLLGIDTTDGIQSRYYIDKAFTNSTTTINEAIQNLLKVDKDRDEKYKDYWPRWDHDKAVALKSLLEYKLKHFCTYYSDTCYHSFLTHIAERRLCKASMT